MKAILLSIKPKWVAKILNGEKTIEVRKKFPKDYVGWVYLYCSKDIRNGLYWADKWVCVNQKNCIPSIRNGKVVARFWCDKVEEIETCERHSPELLDRSCLNANEFYDYLTKGKNFLGRVLGFAIHISKLEIFDRPRELSEFYTVNKIGIPQYQFGKGTCDYKKITKAPQSFMYVEVE